MNCVTIKPRKLYGKIEVPSSKSACHRAIIAAGLAEGESLIENVAFSEDISATIEAMESLGVSIKMEKEKTLRITGCKKLILNNNVIHCGESGSTLRFFIPIAMLSGEKVTFTGRGKLVSRPLKEYYDIFDKDEIKYSAVDNGLPLTIYDGIKPGTFELKGNISSQFVTGLLFALPKLKDDSKVIITKSLESRPYVDLTIDMLRRFSVDIVNNNYKEFYIKGNQRYHNIRCRVEGDYSQAAFWIVSGILGGEVISSGLNSDSLQGDKIIIDIARRMDGSIKIEDDTIVASESDTTGTIIDASECPDLVPILAVLASVSRGTTEIKNAARLRIKESDRLKAIAAELNKLGAEVIEKDDGLIINGRRELNGGVVESWNDHRIAMALAVASIKCKEEVVIKNSSCVNKSYPGFWKDFKMIGGRINEWSMGEEY